MSTSEVPEGFSEWEMVETGDTHLLEGLQVQVDPSEELNSSSSSPSVEDGGGAEEDLQSGSEISEGGIGRHLRFRFEVLRTGFFHLGSRVHDFAASGARFWPVLSVSRVLVVAVLMSVLYRKVRQRSCQLREERSHSLDLLLRDKKINGLLLHVVCINKRLSARRSVAIQHQRVPIPVIRQT